MKYVPQDDARLGESREVFSVKDYCDSHKLDAKDFKRLKSLLGAFATKQEIQMNLHRRPAWR